MSNSQIKKKEKIEREQGPEYAVVDSIITPDMGDMGRFLLSK
jgi:hypothetical protein